MSELVPITTTTLGVNPEIAGKIIAGLSTRVYEQVGGVIRRVDNKKVVAWLRTMAAGQSVDVAVLSKLRSLLQLNIATSILELSITAVGFGLVLTRLKSIEDELATISKELDAINRKLDLSFYANFRAALDLARDAFGMRGDANRQSNASLAISRFLEAEHYYLDMLDTELQAGGPAVTPFFSTLVLAYVSTARCYLELDEADTAWRHFQEGEAALPSRVKQYYDSIIGCNPAIFLHPALADAVSLERLTRLLRHYDASLTESIAFERLRKSIWDTASQNPETWLRRLPSSVWNHHADIWEKQVLRRLPRSGDKLLEQVLPRLPEAFSQVELAQESLSCIQGYGIELKYLIDHNIEYSAWQHIELPATSPDDPVAFLLPEDSELLAN